MSAAHSHADRRHARIRRRTDLQRDALPAAGVQLLKQGPERRLAREAEDQQSSLERPPIGPSHLPLRSPWRSRGSVLYAEKLGGFHHVLAVTIYKIAYGEPYSLDRKSVAHSVGSCTIFVCQKRSALPKLSWLSNDDRSTIRTTLSGIPREFDGDHPIKNGPPPSSLAPCRSAS